jgi:DnaJ-class molecular chaperone
MNETKTNWDHIDPKDPKGYYAYFGVSPEADLATITTAYMKVIKECSGNSFIIKEANRAYEILSDSNKRRFYDTHQSTIPNKKSKRNKDKTQKEKPEPDEFFDAGLLMGLPIKPIEPDDSE